MTNKNKDQKNNVIDLEDNYKDLEDYYKMENSKAATKERTEEIIPDEEN